MMPAAIERIEEALFKAARDLERAEKQLRSDLRGSGQSLATTMADRRAVMFDHIAMHAPTPGGILIIGEPLAGGACWTGIPYTDAAKARALGFVAPDDTPDSAPGAPAFWGAFDAALARPGVSAEGLFSQCHITPSVPFDAPLTPEVLEAAKAHVHRQLAAARPQVIVSLGATAMQLVGEATHDHDIVDLAAAPENSWLDAWPLAAPSYRLPYVTVRGRAPFRAHFRPLPAAAGPLADEARVGLDLILAQLV